MQEAPLLKVQCPCLFVSAESDPLCPPAALAEVQQRMQSTAMRNVTIQVRSVSCPTGHKCSSFEGIRVNFKSPVITNCWRCSSEKRLKPDIISCHLIN